MKFLNKTFRALLLATLAIACLFSVANTKNTEGEGVIGYDQTNFAGLPYLFKVGTHEFVKDEMTIRSACVNECDKKGTPSIFSFKIPQGYVVTIQVKLQKSYFAGFKGLTEISNIALEHKASNIRTVHRFTSDLPCISPLLVNYPYATIKIIITHPGMENSFENLEESEEKNENGETFKQVYNHFIQLVYEYIDTRYLWTKANFYAEITNINTKSLRNVFTEHFKDRAGMISTYQNADMDPSERKKLIEETGPVLDQDRENEYRTKFDELFPEDPSIKVKAFKAEASKYNARLSEIQKEIMDIPSWGALEFNDGLLHASTMKVNADFKITIKRSKEFTAKDFKFAARDPIAEIQNMYDTLNAADLAILAKKTQLYESKTERDKIRQSIIDHIKENEEHLVKVIEQDGEQKSKKVITSIAKDIYRDIIVSGNNKAIEDYTPERITDLCKVVLTSTTTSQTPANDNATTQSGNSPIPKRRFRKFRR